MHDFLDKVENKMSQWLDNINALIARIAQGNGTDQATKDAVAELKTQMDSNDATDADLKAAVEALANKLAAAPPTP